MYNAFISYRKKSSVNADFIHHCIADKSSYSLEDIFLDKHNIGPELFDSKIKTAIADSSCVVLLVTEGCFKAKEANNEDWFLKEIKTALDYKKRIIPVLFDKIESLSDETIVSTLRENFTEDEIEVLTKTQSIPYSVDFPDASIDKLIKFIDETNVSKKGCVWSILSTLRVIGVIAAIVIAFFVAFFGLGVLWGYFASSTTNESVLAEHSIIEGASIHFEYEGWNAVYNLDNDSISIDLESFENKPRMSTVELALASFTYSGSKLIFDKNISYLKHVKFLKGGSKQAKIAFFCASAVACVGAFCGFSQGNNFGKSKRQEETALLLYPKLQQRSTWKPLLKNNIFLTQKYQWWEMAKAFNGLTVGMPNDTICIAYRNGLTQPMVLLKYNHWVIGKNNFIGLTKMLENSKDEEKDAIFLNMQDLSVATYHFPKGIVGIVFQPYDGHQGRYELAIEKYKNWEQKFLEHKGFIYPN